MQYSKVIGLRRLNRCIRPLTIQRRSAFGFQSFILPLRRKCAKSSPWRLYITEV